MEGTCIDKRIKLREQSEEWFPFISSIGLKVHCGTCGEKVNFSYMYRCLYCGFFFCKECAKKHFGSPAEIVGGRKCRSN